MPFQETKGDVGVGWTSHARLMKLFKSPTKGPDSRNTQMAAIITPSSQRSFGNCARTVQDSVPVPAY